MAPLCAVPVRGYRKELANPYKAPNLGMTDFDLTKQEEKPVWDRVFDFKKYMNHTDSLKV